MLVLTITSLVVLKSDLQSLQRKNESENRYETVSVTPFQKLDFKGPWIVQIRNGKDHKVEWQRIENDLHNPRMENKLGTLYFAMQNDIQDSSQKQIKVKITVPSLISIKAVSGSRIHLKDFDQDSLSVQLEEGVILTGYDSDFKKVSYTTSGNVTLQLTHN